MLNTRRLEITPLTVEDIPAFVAYRRHPEIARYQSWSTDYDTAAAEALVAGQPGSVLPSPGEWVQLGLHALIGSPPARTLVGDVAMGADLEQPSTFELGVTLAPDHHGAGYATEVLSRVVDELFGVHDAHRIVMQGDARNAAVLALMGRLELRHEGTILEGDWFKGEWTTLERYALLRREWAARGR